MAAASRYNRFYFYLALDLLTDIDSQVSFDHVATQRPQILGTSLGLTGASLLFVYCHSFSTEKE